MCSRITSSATDWNRAGSLSNLVHCFTNALSVDATTGAMVWCILHNALGGARRNAHDDDGIDSGRSGERGDREWDVGFHHATNPGGDEGGGGVLCHSRRRTNRIYLFRYDRFVATAGGCGTFLSGIQCAD